MTITWLERLADPEDKGRFRILDKMARTVSRYPDYAWQLLQEDAVAVIRQYTTYRVSAMRILAKMCQVGREKGLVFLQHADLVELAAHPLQSRSAYLNIVDTVFASCRRMSAVVFRQLESVALVMREPRLWMHLADYCPQLLPAQVYMFHELLLQHGPPTEEALYILLSSVRCCTSTTKSTTQEHLVAYLPALGAGSFVCALAPWMMDMLLAYLDRCLYYLYWDYEVVNEIVARLLVCPRYGQVVACSPVVRTLMNDYPHDRGVVLTTLQAVVNGAEMPPEFAEAVVRCWGDGSDPQVWKAIAHALMVSKRTQHLDRLLDTLAVNTYE